MLKCNESYYHACNGKISNTLKKKERFKDWNLKTSCRIVKISFCYIKHKSKHYYTIHIYKRFKCYDFRTYTWKYIFILSGKMYASRVKGWDIAWHITLQIFATESTDAERYSCCVCFISGISNLVRQNILLGK